MNNPAVKHPLKELYLNQNTRVVMNDIAFAVEQDINDKGVAGQVVRFTHEEFHAALHFFEESLRRYALVERLAVTALLEESLVQIEGMHAQIREANKPFPTKISEDALAKPTCSSCGATLSLYLDHSCPNHQEVPA